MVRTAYATTKEVLEFLSWINRIPQFVSGSSPTLEIVDNSATLSSASIIYLDKDKVVSNTLDLSYGSVATSTTALVEDTDYTFNIDTSEIILKGTGKTKVGTANIYAKYQYNNFIDDSVLSSMIDRAIAKINNDIHQEFGTAYFIEREEHTGRGKYDRIYRTNNLKLQFHNTQINTASIGTSTTDTTLYVKDTSGFKISDICSIEKEAVKVSSIASATQMEIERGYFGTSTATNHNKDTYVANTVVEISNSPIGTVPNYNVLRFKADYDIDGDTGAVQLLHINVEDKDDIVQDVFPLHKIFDRVRLTYRSGTQEIPDDLRKLTIYVVALDVMNQAISGKLAQGINGFNPTAKDTLDAEIKTLKKEFEILLTKGF